MIQTITSAAGSRSRVGAVLVIGALLSLITAGLPPALAEDTDGSDGLTERSLVDRGLRRVVISTGDGRFDRGVDNQGWWSTLARSHDSNDNYLVGECGDCRRGKTRYRNFFTFDLSEVEGEVVAARLVVRRYRSEGDPVEKYGLFKVSTGAARLNDNEGRDPRIFRDLGTGTSYGEFWMRTGVDPKTTVGMWLNDAAVANINDAPGRYFSVGGSLLSSRLSDGQVENLFAYSELIGDGLQELRLFVQPATP